ncbi:AMP nucleosidase [Corynebacterium sp. ES2730-CONJ]|uniref:AMP nucleosidase n=1 Tax=Corynebacterium sp. ES2730-CONJ TaxID=2973941 RepID=UPI00216AF098|nr:AMP nucleosidase [Corynebacterium sp. ES2730-CONJ]MCS4532326.1 AMP nucleosidase [Corynebacterium sp. ES2730-CONJ]
MNAVEAVEKLINHYDRSCALATQCCESGNFDNWKNITYPKLMVRVLRWHPIDRTEPFGYVDEAGVYSAVISRPRLLRSYLIAQLERLTSNYPCELQVGDSEIAIAPEYLPDFNAEVFLQTERPAGVPRPSLDMVDDAIVDGEWEVFHRSEKPLFHFSPQRFDMACARIEHYTGIGVQSVQKYLLFTNYGMHMSEFLRFALFELHRPGSRYHELVTASGAVLHSTTAEYPSEEIFEQALRSLHQMPRLDLVAADNSGVTMVNIGVGPSNAKTITDCLAVLRPEAWIMIGHCAGLDGRMRIGDLILGNAYQRSDNLLNGHIPLDLPIPAIPEVQRALEASVKEIYGEDLSLMRTGTVISTDDRNWEWHTPRALWEWLRGSTAAACDMESATLAANGYRYRVPYGTLLSVSDLPLNAVPKLPAGAQAFYSSSKEAHVMCAVRAVEKLAAQPEKLHTRKLRRTVAELPLR